LPEKRQSWIEQSRSVKKHDPLIAMPEILLIQPPIRDFYLTKKRTIPYGLLCLAASLIENGFSTEIFDGLATPKTRIIDLPENMGYLRDTYPAPDLSPFALFYHYRHFGYSFEHIGTVARKSDAFLVGISSLFTAYSEEALATATAVKKYHPKCKIVLGGHHPTQFPTEVIDHPAVDFVLRGEAEESLPILAKSIHGGYPLENVPGITYQRSNHGLFVNDPAFVEDLGALPTPAIGLAKHKFYQRYGKNSMVISTSRGCPMKCSYCSVGASSTVPYRLREQSDVIIEIEDAIENHNVGFIDFEDENLALNRRWFMSLLTEIQSRYGSKSIELRAMNGLMPSTLDEKLIKSMKLAGFKSLNLSLCSTSTSQLNRYQRPDTTEAFNNALNAAESYNLNAVGYIIVGGPGQDPGQSVEDLLYLASRKVLAGVSVFYPAPGSLEYDRCEKLGLLPRDFSLMRATTLPISHTTSRAETATLLRLGRILNYMKQLVNRESKFDDPNHNKKTLSSRTARLEQGQKILDLFFKTGNIMGIDPAENLYEHAVAKNLTRQFLKGMQSLTIRGNA